MHVFRVLRRSLIGAATLTLLVAAPAVAHPFIAGGELPVDSLATMQLSMAHGCGGDDGGGEEPTAEVALEVPEWLRIVAVPEADGYVAATESDDDGRVTAVTWTVDGEGVPAPVFDLDVVASGEPGVTRHLAVFQGCANGSYRWVGTPDEPADDPAVNVALVDADPDAPPPPEPEPTPTEDATEPTDEPTGAEPSDEAASDDTDGGDPAGGVSIVLLGGLAIVVLAVVAVLVSRRRGRSGS